MTIQRANERTALDDLAPTDLRLLADPLEFIKVDHIHMRAVCIAMEQVAASDSPDPQVVAALVGFLDRELALLIVDEDVDLHDLLLARCLPEDEIEPTLDRVEAEHQALSDMIPDMLAMFTSLHAAQRAASPDEAALIQRFSALLRRHVMIENAVVLPFARARLDQDDLALLRDSMAARRGANGARAG
ncbi:hypothetical protein FNJ84_10615 [Paracoccus sp. M683]|uniref:hemerythrin domain-containing protein n=1 Tax=Paracoccus sp. M683 TaxID=2594268 RepID=UPI00117F766D|nr:hemerythrin domain-containing protein [Paracoccus sp. M683]TRW96537.1 hypothetical protein FNJ84_10615 [Paracoccus sp. M683]